MASDCCKIITPVRSCRIVTSSNTMQYCAFDRTLRIKTSACAPPETGELPPEEGSWAWIAQIVRSGEAQNYWKVGDILPVQHAVYGEIDFQVAGFDLHNPVDSKKLNTMTLLAKTVVEKMMFDNKENTYGITSDKYFDSQALLNVFISGSETSTLFLKDTDGAWYSGSGSYKLFIKNNRWELWKCTVGSHAGTSIVDYSNALTASPVGVAWNGGTSVFAGKTYYVLSGKQYITTEVVDGASVVSNTYYEKMYDTYRPGRGYNSWKESAVRQWLNSDKVAGEWWSPQNIWDVAPPNAATLDGFLAGILDYGFIQALCPVVIPSLRNHFASGGGIDYTNDLIFLPSRTEIFGSANDGVLEGEQLTLYKGASTADRNKKDKTGADALWWTRSVQGNTTAVTRIRAGNLTNASPADALWLAPMCVIG